MVELLDLKPPWLIAAIQKGNSAVTEVNRGLTSVCSAAKVEEKGLAGGYQ